MALGQVLLVPIFFRLWGEDRYGEWLALSAVAAQIALVDFGVQTYVVNRLNQCYARGELDQYAKLLHSALFWGISLAAIAFVVAVAAVSVLPIGEWLKLELTDPGAVTVIGTLLALQVVLTVPYGILSGIYRTVREFPRGTMIYNVQRVFFFSLTAAALLAGGGLVHVAAVQIVPQVLGMGFVLFDLRRRHPEVSIGLAQKDVGLAISFLAPSSLFFLIRGSQAVSILGALLVVSALFGPAAVALFNTLRMLCNLVRQISNAIINALWPELTSLEAVGERDTLRTVFVLTNKAITAACLAAAVYLWVAGEDVIEVWTRGEATYRAGLMNTLLVMLVLQTPWLVSSIFLMATNRHRIVSVCYAISSVTGIALGALLAQSHGMVGLVVGMLAAELVVCGWPVPKAACELVGASPRRFLVRTLLPVVPVAAIVGGAAWLVAEWTEALPPLAHGLVLTVPVTLVSIPATYALWLDAAERAKVRELATGALARFRRAQ